MRNRNILSLVFFAILLFGCGTVQYVNYDPAKNTQMQYDKDYAECRLAGRDRGEPSISSWYGYCMEAKGWKTTYK